MRIVGEVTPDTIEVVREANWIVEDELVETYKPWQCFAAIVGMGTGVKGDNRVHGWIISVRAVNSRDGMTADPLQLPWEVLSPDRIPHNRTDQGRGPGGVRHHTQTSCHHRI